MLQLVARPLEAIIGLSPQEAWQEQTLPCKLSHRHIGNCQLTSSTHKTIMAEMHGLQLNQAPVSQVVSYRPMAMDDDLHSRLIPGLLGEEPKDVHAELATLVATLAQLLDVRFAILGEFSGSEEQRVNTRFLWKDGDFVANMFFPITASPWERIDAKSGYYSMDQTWQNFPNDPMLGDLRIACFLGVPLCDGRGQMVGQLAIMHDHPQSPDWLGQKIIQAFGTRASTILEQCLRSESDAKNRRFLRGLKKLSQILARAKNLASLLGETTDQVRQIFASDHVWLARLPQASAPDSGTLVESRAESCPPLHRFTDPSNQTAALPTWQDLQSLASQTPHFLKRRPPFANLDRSKPSPFDRQHMIQCLRPRTGPIWLFGILPSYQDSGPGPPQDSQHFQEIGIRVNEMLSHLLLVEGLEKSQKQYKNLVETIGEIIFQTDAQLNLQYLNPAWSTITGWSLQTSLGKYLGKIFVSDHRQEIAMILGEMLVPDQPNKVWEVRLATSDNNFKWVQVQAHPLFNSQGQCLGLSGMLKEIVKEQVGSTELSRNEQICAFIEETTQIAVQGYDINLKVLTWNRASQKIFGYSAEEAEGRCLDELIIPPTSLAAWKSGLQSWLKHGVPLKPGELSLRGKNGRQLTIYANHTLLRNGQGAPEFYTIGVDLTEQKRTATALLESEKRYRKLVELSPQAMFLIAKDQIFFANPAAVNLLGANELQDVLGRKLINMVPQALRSSLTASLATMFNQSGGSSTPHHLDTLRLLRLDGRQTEVDMIAISVTYAGVPAIQIIAQDITEQKRAAEALRHSEARYALAAQGANDGLWDWDLVSDKVYYSPRWHAMLGLQDSPANESPNFWLDRVHPEDIKNFQSKLEGHLKGDIPQFENEHRLSHSDGEYRWMHCRGVAVFDDSGKPKRIAGSLRDITERKKVEHQLFHDAFHDNLTGLANRALFMEHLDRALKRGKPRPERLIAIVFIDIDRFKLVNDSLGHFVGDKLLNAMASRLGGSLSVKDLFARLGGDEFAILIEDIEYPIEARNRAQTVHRCLKEPFYIGSNELYTSVSIGISFGVPGRDRSVNILREADTAMYRAKARGKAQSVVFDQSMHEEVNRVMTLENDLRKAMDRNEFEVYFQPIIDLRSLRLAGFEALLRWNHPTNGIIFPDQFISLAEETGIILPLGLKVLRQASQLMVSLHKSSDPSLFLHVNLSFRQMMQSDLKGQIEDILNETHLPPDRLKLELTESVVAEPGDFAIALLHDLRQLGIRLCLDDFGTGYASLSYLHRLPIDSLKIDKSFIDRLFIGDSSKAMVPTIISLAHNLGLTVIAEGVETEAQFRKLLDLGCEFAQGFHFGKPVNAATAKRLCRDALIAP